MAVTSRQPRFSATIDPNDLFASIVRIFTTEDEDPMPPYKADSRDLDRWMQRFLRREPHLNGVVNSVATIDKNRGWSVTGGKRQVRRITDMLHNFECAPGLIGWRPGFGYASKSFWSTNMGAVVELGRAGEGGPVRKLYNTDPMRCALSGEMDTPLKYYPPRGQRVQKWSGEDFFRVVSNVDLDEDFKGLGECAVYRAVGIAQLMVALMNHNAESLLARAPRGLLLLSGISQTQWDQAMAARDVELDANEVKYFGALAVLASANESVDAKLVALSQLPQSFNLKEWMDMTLYGYSLCFGYDASEFWPVQYGALGRGNETQIQHEKATGKGRLDFVLGFQEQLQNYLPPTVDYAVEQRDDQGDLLHASVLQAWADVAKSMYEAKDSTGLPLITNEEARVLLAEFGVIPSTWSPTAEVGSSDLTDVEDEPVVDQPSDVSSTGGQSTTPNNPDTETNPVSASPTAQSIRLNFERRHKIREALLASPQIRLAAERFGEEPIVRYEYSKEFPKGRIFEMWSSGADLLRPMSYPSALVPRIGVQTNDEDKIVVVQPNVVVNMPELGAGQAMHFEKPGKYVVEREGQKFEIHVPAPEVSVDAPNIQVIMPDQPTLPERRQVDPVEPNITFSPTINVPVPEVFVDNVIQLPKDPRKERISVERGPDGKIKSVDKEILDD